MDNITQILGRLNIIPEVIASIQFTFTTMIQVTKEPVKGLASIKLYSEDPGIKFDEFEGGYLHAKKVESCKGFAPWPLSLVAKDCFGQNTWPEDVPRPQAWLEFDVEDLKETSTEMKRKGYRLLLDSYNEPYGQIVTRFLSPEGILVGLTVTPWLREEDKGNKQS